MAWEPTSKDELLAMIEVAEFSMGPPVLAFWKRIRVSPVKWQLSPWGDMGGGFWVVAVIGQGCVWYNDIEDGFNMSRFETFGRIAEYWCNQTELEPCIGDYFSRFLRAVTDVGTTEES